MTKVFAILKNGEGYTLTMTKERCQRPDNTYRIILSEEVKKDIDISVREHSFFMSEKELGDFARALVA